MKHKLFYAVVVTLTAMTVIMYIKAFNVLSVYAAANGKIDNELVLIDAGHGGFDPGAVADDGTQEKDINLEIALILYDIFRANGHSVKLVRNCDTAVGADSNGNFNKKNDLKYRLESANRCTTLISIHQNAYSDTSQHGSQVFYGPQNDSSEILAEYIKASLLENADGENKREIKCGTDSIYMLYNTVVPAVLVECGFITNDEELMKLTDSEYQKKLAYAIYAGYCDYLNYGS